MRAVFTTILFALAALAQPPDLTIEAARAEAARYAQSIPNYIVIRTTTRFRAKKYRNPDWHHTDTVSAEVAAHDNQEFYSGIRINGKLAKALPSDGMWSNGEFSILLDQIFAPQHAAIFTDRTADTRQSRPAWRYNFSIDAKHSGWDVIADLLPYRVHSAPAYSGAVWIDRDNAKVLRIERSASSIPYPFPLRIIDSSTDYSPVRINDENYMLPTHSVTITCTRDKSECLRNETVFENYRKFGASTSLTWEK